MNFNQKQHNLNFKNNNKKLKKQKAKMKYKTMHKINKILNLNNKKIQ